MHISTRAERRKRALKEHQGKFKLFVTEKMKPIISVC
jgi:hypothetical protein